MSRNRRTGTNNIFALALYTLVFFMIVPVAAPQERATVRRISFLLTGFKPPKEFFDAMAGLGYVDGQNIRYEYRNGEDGEKRLLKEAANLAQEKPEVLIVAGAAAGLAAKKSTQTVPIVYLGGGDPVALGLVQSLSQPGGNLTGVTELSPELTAKRLELLKETFPAISRVSVLVRFGAPEIKSQLEELERQAAGLKFKLHVVETRDSKDVESSLATAIPQDAGALIELPNPLFHANITRIVNFALKHKLPTIFHSKDFVEAGGLMAYGADFTDLYRRAATYVDKILKGTQPRDLPVQQPTKFELVVNLKTAKQIGLTIPPNVLARADRVIR